MSVIKFALIFAIFSQLALADGYEKSFQEILDFNLKKIPFIRMELRDGFESDLQNIYVDFFLKQTICPKILSTYSLTTTKHLPHLRESFVIVADMKTLLDTVKLFAETAGTFFIIIIGTIDPPRLDIIFRKLWNIQGIYRTMLLTSNGIMFFDPFVFDVKKRTYGGIVPIHKRDLETIFDDMNGYPLRVQMFKSVYSRPIFDATLNKVVSNEGADGEVAALLQSSMNFTMVLQEPTKDYFGERAKNGTYNGAIGMIINSETDICLTGFFLKDYLVPLEFTVTVYADQLCCYVHKADKVPPSLVPICAVRMNFWLAFFLAGFLFGTIWIIFRRLNLLIHPRNLRLRHLSRHLRYQFLRIYNDTWVVWVKANLVRYPPFTSERIIVLSMCLVSVIFGAIIESSLATVYIHPMYYDDIETLHALERSGLDIVYKYTSFKDDLFFNETSPLFASLNRKLKHLNDLNADLIRDIAESGGMASVTRYNSLMTESKHYIMSKKIHVVEECPKNYLIGYVLPRDSPFTERVNALLLRFLNAGLIDKWVGDMDAKVNREIMMSDKFQEHSDARVLTLIDLQLAFYVVIGGSFISVLSLGAEFYVKHRMSFRMNSVD